MPLSIALDLYYGTAARRIALLRTRRVHRRRDRCREAIDTAEVFLDSVEQSFGAALAVFRLLQPLLVGGIADEGDLRQHGRHIRAHQHHKRRFADASVSFRSEERRVGKKCRCGWWQRT